MKIIIASTPVTGHVNPMLAMARLLVANGDEVVGFTASAFAPRFAKIGAKFSPFPASIDVDLSDANSIFPERKQQAPGPELLLYDFTQFFIKPLSVQHAGLRDLLKEFPADVILADGAFFGTFPLLLGPRSERPAIVHCGLSVLFTSRDDRAPAGAGLPPARTAEELQQYRDIHADVAKQLLDPVQHAVNHTLAALGHGPLAMPLLDAAAALSDLYLQPSVPSFEYPRSKLPQALRFVGAVPQPTGQAPLPEWAGDLDGSRRIVLVTQGTVSNYDTRQLIEPTMAALADRPDLLVVVTTGGRPVESVSGPLPANVRIAQFLPFEWLMPRVDLLVTNGGYGTVMQALSLGIPVVAAGLSEDKAEVAAHIAWRGVGINLATNTPTVPALRAAIDAVLDSQHYSEAAKSLSREYRDYNAATAVPRLLAEVVSPGNARRSTAPAMSGD